MEGAAIMNYKIEKMDAFTVLGVERTFNEENSFQEIPKYWGEFFQRGYQKLVCPVYGICFDMCDSGGDFQYLIGDNCEADAEVPDGFVKRKIPAHTWAIFSCTGAMPEAIQKVNRQIYTEWLPGNPEYEVADGINIEMYSDGDTNSTDYYSEIWLPVKKK
jgi:AraC family transcriptional regulator